MGISDVIHTFGVYDALLAIVNKRENLYWIIDSLEVEGWRHVFF